MVARLIQRYFAELAFVFAEMPVDVVSEIVQRVVAAHARGATVYTLGNGGSAATASHFACDLQKYGRAPGGRALRALSLTDAVPILTAVANDLDYERVFAEQLSVHARPGDLVIAISASGNSPNVLRCIELARSLGLSTIALAGFGGGRLGTMVDLALKVPGSNIQVVEDAHSAICHSVSRGVAAALAEGGRASAAAARPAIFCDRDGVLNGRRPDHVKSMDEFEFLPGALEALVELRSLDAPVVVITNQSVIGRGLASAADVEHIHARMKDAVQSAGGPELTVYVCPHAPQDSCDCRKPRPGLLLRAAADHGLDLERSVFIGDSMSDVCAALTAGCHPMLVGPTPPAIAAWPEGMVTCVPSLADALPALRRLPQFSALVTVEAGAPNVNGVAL